MKNKMNKRKALEILEAQRDSFMVDADNTKLSDYEEWCNAKAKDFQEIMDWIDKGMEE